MSKLIPVAAAAAVLASCIAVGAVLSSERASETSGNSIAAAAPVQQSRAIPNDAIDMPAFLEFANQAAAHREPRRLTEQQFLDMSREPGTIVLDARSRQLFDVLHIEGAVNLPFPDIAVDTLAQLIPDKGTRILIYCNNNFRDAERPFPSKIAPASLNLSTYIALYSYGYRNIYELGPRVRLEESILPFESNAPADDLLSVRPEGTRWRSTPRSGE